MSNPSCFANLSGSERTISLEKSACSRFNFRCVERWSFLLSDIKAWLAALFVRMRKTIMCFENPSTATMKHLFPCASCVIGPAMSTLNLSSVWSGGARYMWVLRLVFAIAHGSNVSGEGSVPIFRRNDGFDIVNLRKAFKFAWANDLCSSIYFTVFRNWELCLYEWVLLVPGS